MLLQNVPNGDVGNLTQGKTNASTMTMNIQWISDAERQATEWDAIENRNQAILSA
jgi:hypothetical protein